MVSVAKIQERAKTRRTKIRDNGKTRRYRARQRTIRDEQRRRWRVALIEIGMWATGLYLLPASDRGWLTGLAVAAVAATVSGTLRGLARLAKGAYNKMKGAKKGA